MAKAEDVGVKILSDVGFKTPESITYDAEQDVYFVSNINGSPTEKDDNGFISKVTPEGEVELTFIDGAKGDFTLNAPKGLAVGGGVLYVADIDTVRLFDAKSGAFKSEVKLPGATFVNDVALSTDGGLYVTDSGLRPDFSPSGTDAVYKIVSGKLTRLLASKDLGGPNGVAADVGGTWVVTFGSGELFWVADKGAKKEKVQKLPKGGCDGIVLREDGHIYVSSWEASAVFRGASGAEFHELLGGVNSPADIGFDSKRNRLLIPLFQKDSVIFQTISPEETSAGSTHALE